MVREARVPRAAPGCIEKIKNNVFASAEVMDNPGEFNDAVADISNLVVVQDWRAMDGPHLWHKSPGE